MSGGTHFAAIAGRYRATGFTLVEVMVALTILSLVMLVTVTGFRTLGNTQGAITRLTGRVDEIRSVSSYLRDLFESTVVGEDYGGFTAGGGDQGEARFALGEDFRHLRVVAVNQAARDHLIVPAMILAVRDGAGERGARICRGGAGG